MENASKALIIAGAILISILLISVGIIIMNAINEPVQQGASSAESQAIEMFNANFTEFEGVRTGAQLRGLTAKVNASNAENAAHQVNVVFAGGETSSAFLDASTEYRVELTYANGYVTQIDVGV